MNLYLVQNQRNDPFGMIIKAMVVAAPTPEAAAYMSPVETASWTNDKWLLQGYEGHTIDCGPTFDNEWDHPKNLKVTLLGTAVAGTAQGLILGKIAALEEIQDLLQEATVLAKLQQA